MPYSYVTSAEIRPVAAWTEAVRGMTTLRTPSCTAQRATCTGADPPMATMANSRGSYPRSTVQRRMRSLMWALMMRKIPPGGLDCRHVQRLRDALFDGGCSLFLVQGHATSQEIPGIQVTEDHVGVAYGGLGSTKAVRHGARRGARSWGPTFSSPDLSSIQAMLPPPAPMDATHIFGARML